MKILAAIMDIVHVKKDGKIKQYFVYDPTIVSVLTKYPEKEK